MAQITINRDGRKLYIGDFVDPSRFTTNEKPYRPRNAEFAIRGAKMLRDAGESTARAVTEASQGEASLESESAIQAETATPTADNRSTSFRGITPEKIGSKWFIRWHDGLSDQDYSISGNTPQQCLENLFSNEHPIVVRYRETLPPEGEPTPQTPPPIPPVPVAANGRVLRPGSQSDVRTIDLPERRSVQTDGGSAAHVSFQQWEQSASVAQLKDRLRSDVAFATWYQSQQAVTQPKGVF
jgi:hypothetical protein